MTEEEILAQADAALDAEVEKPEKEEEDPVEALLSQADQEIGIEPKPKKKKVLVPGMDMGAGIGMPMQEDQVQEAPVAEEKPKQEQPEINDPVDVLFQLTGGKPSSEYDEKVFQWRDTLNDEQISRVAQRDPSFPLTDTQDRMAYGYLRKQSPFKIPRNFEDWYGIAEYTAGMVPAIAEPVAESVVSFVKGGAKFASKMYEAGIPQSDYGVAINTYDSLPDDAKERVREKLGSIPNGMWNPKGLPDAEVKEIVLSELPQETRDEVLKKQDEAFEESRSAGFSAIEPIVGLPISMGETAVKVGTGGISAWDRLTESVGIRTYDDSFENWRNRRLFDGAMQQWTAQRPTSYAKALEIMAPAMVSIAKLDGPTVEDYMREEGLTREQAELARDYDAEQWTLDSINKVQEENIPDIDEEIRTFGEFALPAGFGLDQFGYAMNLARVGSWATPRLYTKIRLAGMTPDQVNQYYSDKVTKAQEWAEKKFQQRTKQGVVEKAAGSVDDQLRRIQVAMDQSAFWKRVRQAAPYVAGGAVGYGITEDPLAVLYGPMAGRLATGFPGFLRDWREARRISAGGAQGQFATLAEIRQDRANAARGRKFDPEAPPPIRLKGSVSERIQDFGGEKLDNIVDNIGEYVRMGVEPTLLGIGVGAINSYDDEELGSTIGMGLVYSLGGRGIQQIQKKLFGGVDPVIEARKMRQDMNDLQKVYRDASPETREEINKLSDWNTVVAAKEAELAQAQKGLKDATDSGNVERISKARKTVELREATVARVKRANVQTRNEYSRQWLRNLARINMLGNGTLREGMNNVGINILTTEQIFKKLRENPANANVSDDMLRQAAEQTGFYSPTNGNAVFKPGAGAGLENATFVFDASKPSIVVNSDTIKSEAANRGQIPVYALNHEFGHHLKNVPEYAELIKDAEGMLFSQEVKDLSGKVVATTPGKYSVDDLLDIYWNRYLAGYTRAEKADFARMNGLLDQNGNLKRDETAAYMRNEIMADLGAETVSRYLDPAKDGAVKEIYDRALLKFRTKRLARLVDKLRSAGGTGDVITDVTMAELEPEVVRLGVDALKAYDALKNQVSPAVPQSERPKISRAQIMRDRSLLARYGADSPIFSTSIKAQVFDNNGNPVGASIPVNLTDRSLSEGVWERTESGVKQISGYGRLSPQIDLRNVPVGSRIVISNQIDYQADGVTPVILNPREAKKRGQERAKLIREALDNTADYGAPNRFQPIAPGSDTYRGTFTPLQIKALRDIPEAIVPKSIKDRILAFNDALARNDGTRMIVDYAAVMTDSGKYQAFSPKLYDVVPIGMMFSKDGNFLATTISVTRLFDKLNAWSERMPARLDFWNGSKERFWSDFEKKYLANWQKGIPGSGYTKEGKLVEGSTPLDADAQIADQKKNIFDDFLNLFDKETEGLNPDRTVTPRRRGDARDKNIDRTIMSMRLDHVAEVLENPMGKLPIVYGYAKQNFLPKPKSNEGSLEKPEVDPINVFKGNIRDAGFKYITYSDLRKEGRVQDWEKEGGVTIDGSYYPTAVIGDTKVAFTTSGLYVFKNQVRELYEQDVDSNGNTIFTIQRIVTPEGKRGQGNASKALSQITDAADKAGLSLQLQPAVISTLVGRGGELSAKQLVDWYKRNGFTQKFEGSDAVLIRSPQKTSIPQAVPPRKKIEGEEMPFKVVTQNRNPELQQAAQRLIRGEIDTAEYQALVRDVSPYEDLPDVPEPMSVESMKAAIAGESRKAKVGIVRDVLKQNDEAESRIDIKAFENFGEYVSTIHKPTKKEVGGEAATPIAHESTVHLKDVRFMVNPTQSLEIAAGRSKGTIARINGKWQDTSAENAFELANEKFNDPEWVQLGMNPTRQSNFYIRSTGEPVKSADEVIQVGKFVLAKNPKKVSPDEMPERTMTDYGVQFMPRPKKADEAEEGKRTALSGVEPPVLFSGRQGTALEGLTVQYEPEAKMLEGISFAPAKKPDRYTFAYTTSSDRIKLVDDLVRSKNWQAIRDLNQASVRHAMSDLPGVKYQVKDVLGAFENGREVSASVEVEIDSPETLAEVRKRMVALGELWKQTEVLEEKVGRGDLNLLGTVDSNGYLHIHKYELDFEGLTPRMVEKARRDAGIQSMTIDGNKVTFYDTDNLGTGFGDRIAKFASSITEDGGVLRASTEDNAAVRSYRDPSSVKPGSLYYNDDPVRLFGAGQLPDRLQSPVYRVVSELLGRPLPPPKDGKRSYFVKSDVTPKQVKLQNAIGNTQDRVILNDRKNKDVVRAYEELNAELLKQFDALVASGMRFEAINDYETYGKTYPNSAAVIRDIRNNSQLMFLKTNPDTFGPLKDGKPMDFGFHPLLQDSGRVDSAGNKLNYNDILRVVHDAIAHGTYSVEFGPIGEESAWHTHIRTIENPWARWALTMETRGQNSFVNYRDARIGKDKMPLKPGDDGYVPIPERDYAEQKFALIPLKYSLTGDAKVDKPVKDLMAEIGEKRAQGSVEKRPDWMPSKAKEKEILSKVPQPAGNPKTMVADATAVLGKPTKADEASSVPVIVSKEWMKKKAKKDEDDSEEDDGDTLTVGEAQLKDVVKYELTGLPIVVRPLPNYAAENNATKVAKNVLKIAERPNEYKEYSDRVVAAGEKVRNDPQRFTTLSGYLEFMRESGASGNLLMPPTQLVELVKNAQHILNLWNGGYHGTKTAPGTVKAAKEGLDSVNEMKSLMTENGVNLGPTPMITALHHLWGILSRQLDPLNQEGLWMRMVSNPRVLEQIQRSIDGEYNLTREQWKDIVQKARRETKGNYEKIGNNATANANSFALMLERHNGKWDQLASIYRLDDPVAMTNAFWGLNVGPTGIKNKVQRFIGLTFGIHGSVLDRWRFVSLNLPMAMKLTGKPIPESYFKYYGKNKTIPEDPVGIYKSYGTVENGNPVYSTALYTGIDRTIEGVIANSPALRNFLGVHATPGGFHWVDWNTVKNEAVGHSSLDLTKEFLKQKGRDATVDDFLDVVQNSTVYTRADQDGKILDLVMENGVFRIRED